ncbi:MAG: hypothetical protein HZB65_00295 [Candidatus Aenigmarchaeota archaeon]|nr:hypothetical protein [Candidatus Aenigmarchaeota archaeon]
MGITCNSVRCGFVFLFLALSVFVFSSGTAMAGSLEDAAYTLNAVGASMIPDNFIEISSIQCSSQALPGYTSEKSSSLGQNEWDALDLNPGTQFNLKIINEIGAVQYTPIAYIPVINSSSVEGISLYARKKYIAIVSPDGNLSYRYENNTIIRENMLFNLSIYSKDSAIYNASINNIPVYTGQMTNQSGLVIEKNIMAETTGSGVFNPVVINKTRYSIKLYNNSLISPDRLIELPVENNSAFLNILHRNTFKRIDIKNESIIINSSSDFSADRRILGYIVLENAEHAKAIIAENNTIAFEAMQFIGKIPITKIGNNYAIPVLNRTIDRNLYGNAVGIIPLLSMEYIYDNSVPGSAKASCEIKFAKKQILKGIEIVPTTAMQIDRVIAGDREIPINKALSPGKKQTIYYNEPAYADKLNIEFSAPTMQCSQSEIYQKCQQFCSLGRNSAMNLGILGAGNGCMTNCTQKSCFKADIGFSEIMTKPAEVKIEVNPELDFIRDPYLQAYTQFFSAETIDIKGTLETNTHTCQGGARQNCLDIDIIPCEEKRFTRNLVQECRHWEAACPGGWAMKASSCRQGERCELNTVGRVLLGALGSIAFGGIHNFWSALAYSSAETVLTDVIHLPSWLASAVMSTIAPINLDGTTKWTFRFTGDFFTKVAVRYAQDQAYQQIMKSLGAGNFLEKLLANVLVSWVNIVGNNIADSEMRKAFFKGNWVGVNKERLFRVIPTDALIKTTLIELTGGVKTDSWVVMLAAAYASSELTGMIYKDRSEMIKTLENKGFRQP